MSFLRGLQAVAAVALATAGGFTAAQAADLYGGQGSLKDDTRPILMRTAGPCYLRGDVGYSLSNTPDVRWPVTDGFGNYVDDQVKSVKIEDTYVLEGGVGCGSGGWRGELMVGYRGNRKIDGEPTLWAPPLVNFVDPLHTQLTSWTLMANAYRDLAHWGAFTPYVGAGIGLAYHDLNKVSFTENPFLTNEIEGRGDWSFAWQLMAGVGYRVSERTTLDIGYRYVDLGKATSGRLDNAGFVNPRVVIDDITAHEFKVGLRFALGGGEDMVPLK